MTVVRSCVLPGARHDELPRDSYACPSCQRHLVRRLGEIEDYLSIVSPLPSRSGDFGPRRPGYASTPPLRLEVVAMLDPRTEINGSSGASDDDDVLDEIPNVWADLGGWARVLMEENPVAVPLGGGWAAFLRSWCSWICQQAWVDEFAADMARVHAALRQACGDAPGRPFAHCPQVIEARVCGGWIAMFDDGTGAQCRTCRSSWRRDQLLDLLERVAAVKAG